MVGIKKLDKSELLIREGDQSSSMYWLQSGSLRLFKKKGGGFIELGILHAGELVGEMSFLDNQTRSASVEAITKCDLIEIPRGKFDEVMKTLPSWLNSLIQTLVKRLRAANNRLREIENASTVYTTNELGQKTKVHEFLTTNEILRLSTALLLVATRQGRAQADRSVVVNAANLHMYAAGILQVPVTKVAAYVDVLNEAGVVHVDRDKDRSDITVFNVEFLDKFINFLHDENTKSEEKRLPLTSRGIIVCDMIYQFGDLKSFGDKETATINMEAVYKRASETLKSNITMEPAAFGEVVRSGLASELKTISPENRSTELNILRFRLVYPCVNLRQRFVDLNEEKRSTT